MEESEFGRGMTYNLALFVAHKDRYWSDKKIHELLGTERCVSLWFSAASDHLEDLEIPECLSAELKARIAHFRDKCLDFCHNFALPSDAVTERDYEWAIREALDIMMAIDRTFGIEPLRGECE